MGSNLMDYDYFIRLKMKEENKKCIFAVIFVIIIL
jgi:hypothetical protein